MFTVQDVATEIRKIAAENPDYIYAPRPFWGSCFYTREKDGTPGGCIVGRALMNLGISPGRLVQMDGKDARSVLGVLQSEGYIDNVNGTEDWWIGLVQQHQDFGRTWGDAVSRTDEKALFSPAN